MRRLVAAALAPLATLVALLSLASSMQTIAGQQDLKSLAILVATHSEACRTNPSRGEKGSESGPRARSSKANQEPEQPGTPKAAFGGPGLFGLLARFGGCVRGFGVRIRGPGSSGVAARVFSGRPRSAALYFTGLSGAFVKRLPADVRHPEATNRTDGRFIVFEV
jgi:hypothetical protein